MRIEFTSEERSYIVDNFETDLVLTRVGMSLVEKVGATGEMISVEATDAEIQEFLDELWGEFIRKINRVANPIILRGLARRLLPDYARISRHSNWGIE